MIELGTLRYPYRSFKSLSSEILNQYSHHEKDITIYLKEKEIIYIEDDSTYFLSLGLVTIKSYSKTSSNPAKALLIPTAISQHGISERAVFHLLTHTNIPIDEKISMNSYSASEIARLKLKQVTFKVSRTPISLINVDVYREEIDYNKENFLLYPINLQNRNVTIQNVNFNVTGTILFSTDPLNIIIENVWFDAYSIVNAFMLPTQ